MSIITPQTCSQISRRKNPGQRFLDWVSPLRAWREVRDHHVGRQRFAAGFAVGVFIANLPVYGVQTALSLVTARWLRLHPLSVVAGSHVSTPPVGPLLVMAAIATGHWLRRGQMPQLSSYDPTVAGYGHLMGSVLIEWTLGGVTIGLGLAAVTYFVVSLTLRLVALDRASSPT